MLGFATTSQESYDYVETIGTDSSPVGQGVILLVTFTGNQTQRNPFVSPFIGIWCNGTGESNKLTMATRSWSDTSGRSVGIDRYLEFDKSTLNQPFTRRWRVQLAVFKQVTIRAKATVQGTTGGTVSVVRES